MVMLAEEGKEELLAVAVFRYPPDGRGKDNVQLCGWFQIPETTRWELEGHRLLRILRNVFTMRPVCHQSEGDTSYWNGRSLSSLGSFK